MKTLAETLQNQLSNRQDNSLPTSISKTLNEKNKAQLAVMLAQVCALQKAYGKTPDELETLVEGFSWALADFTMPQIIKAMREYIQTHSDIPAPADIRHIIKNDVPEKKFTIGQLRDFQAKGIPLMPEQIKIIEESA